MHIVISFDILFSFRHGAIYVIYIQPSYTFDTSAIPLIFFAFIFCTVFILKIFPNYLYHSEITVYQYFTHVYRCETR